MSTVLDAAFKALSNAGQPLHYREITKRALRTGLWSTTGKTPEATLSARLATDIKSKGDQSRFRRTGKGVFALNNGSVQTVAPKRAKKTVSFSNAAEQVLKRFGDRKPMHYREITDRALQLGLIATSGKTPEATMSAQIFTEIYRRTRRGEQPRFVKHGRGHFGLTSWQRKGLAHQIQEHNAETRKKLHQRLRKMDPTDFEALVGELLVKLGFDQVEVTAQHSDGGVDVRGTLVVGEVIRTRMAVQAKRWKNNVLAPVVQQVRGSLGAHEQGLIITTSDFSKGARDESERSDATPVALMNGEQLVKVLIENDICVVRASHDLIELAEPGEAES